MAEAAPPDDSRILWTEDVLRYRDSDANGHVNNAVFAGFCESGRVQFFAAHLRPVLAEGCALVIARFVIDYRGELHFPGRVRTGTWLARIGRSSLGFRNRILAEGRLVGEAEAACVVIDAESRRPRPLEGAAREAAERLRVA
ncbi:thioesterase superfamily protein [Methylobacterium sp. 4-46]|uniref:acyl-CoA thioesterase n=1 Tax=unclassified Methylobacterium TaxID=2615210 RepID=UPI000152C4B3|nr:MULTISPECIES: thioesterase family protein [Methylobacterium]ACA17047.1 thioesterase superfamily protein [Methylobacterium sp. 4-46]WFT82736.1 thioesterase family protein [Methylobacterium nodulans]